MKLNKSLLFFLAGVLTCMLLFSCGDGDSTNVNNNNNVPQENGEQNNDCPDSNDNSTNSNGQNENEDTAENINNEQTIDNQKDNTEVSPDQGICSASSWHKHTGNAEDKTFVEAALTEHHNTDKLVPVKIVYVKPYSGVKEGDGTKENPTTDIINTIKNATAGTHIYLLPGEYKMSDIRNAYSLDTSMINLRNDGTKYDPIVVSTIPEHFDVSSDKVAVINWQYDNAKANHRTWAIGLYSDFWIFENLEMKNSLHRIFRLQGNYNIIRNTHLHHVHSDENEELDNDGIIVIATHQNSYNFIINNYIHHIGHIPDFTTGEISNYLGNNIGCIYSETRQHYDSVYPASDNYNFNTSYNDLTENMTEPNGEVYIFNNLFHDGANGVGFKTKGEGPYYVLSNTVYDVDCGIKMSKSLSIIKNNVIYSKNRELQYGILNGSSASQNTEKNYIAHMYNGRLNVFENNIIIDAKYATNLYGGFGTVFKNNIFLLKGTAAHKVYMNYVKWYNSGKYPCLEGEYLWDNNDSNYYWQFFPQYLKDMTSFIPDRLKLQENIYNILPKFTGEDCSGPGYKGKIFDENYQVKTREEILDMFIDPDNYDYRLK